MKHEHMTVDMCSKFIACSPPLGCRRDFYVTLCLLRSILSSVSHAFLFEHKKSSYVGHSVCYPVLPTTPLNEFIFRNFSSQPSCTGVFYLRSPVINFT